MQIHKEYFFHKRDRKDNTNSYLHKEKKRDNKR